MVMATAEMTTINPYFDFQHGVNSSKVDAIVAAGNDLSPILVLEDTGNGYTILDGHHRAKAAIRLGLSEVPAYVVSIAEYGAVLDAHFNGDAPDRLSDLDDYISINGQSYYAAGLR